VDPNHLPASDSSPYHRALSRCIDHWGLVPEKTELVRDGINHVFGAVTVGGAPVIIRISDGAIRPRGDRIRRVAVKVGYVKYAQRH